MAAGIPNRIAADPNWGPYLRARSRLVCDLADQVRLAAAGQAPACGGRRPQEVGESPRFSH
jgi:hypothetical protein